MPIKNRIDMLSTGIRTPVGVKIFGADLDEVQRLGERTEAILRNVPGTRSIFAERAAGGYFVDFVPRREALARYGLTIADVQDVIMTAIGGETISTTIEGRDRFTHQSALPARPPRQPGPAQSRPCHHAERVRRCRWSSWPRSNWSTARP